VVKKTKKKRGKMVKKSEDILKGMLEISSYINRSEATVIRLVNSYEFPAKKICGIWESSKKQVDKWRDAFLDQDDAI
jgi:hypothetical protein